MLARSVISRMNCIEFRLKHQSRSGNALVKYKRLVASRATIIYHEGSFANCFLSFSHTRHSHTITLNCITSKFLAYTELGLPCFLIALLAKNFALDCQTLLLLMIQGVSQSLYILIM